MRLANWKDHEVHLHSLYRSLQISNSLRMSSKCRIYQRKPLNHPSKGIKAWQNPPTDRGPRSHRMPSPRCHAQQRSPLANENSVLQEQLEERNFILFYCPSRHKEKKSYLVRGSELKRT